MSHALFHDTVTLYLPVSDGTTIERRVITGVKTVFTKTANKGNQAVVYLPLWGRRSLKYLPKAWDGRQDRFTVRIGDRLVCGTEHSTIPPEDALTVKTVIDRRSGSRRLWHLEIQADNQTDKEETTNEGTEA